MAAVPTTLLYSAEHEWVRGDAIAGAVVTIGITDHAADALGDVVFAELPAAGTAVQAGAVCGELESSKAVSELFSPVNGTVTEVNDAIASAPGTINADPYEAGWLFKVEISAPVQLMSPEAYEGHIA